MGRRTDFVGKFHFQVDKKEGFQSLLVSQEKANGNDVWLILKILRRNLVNWVKRRCLVNKEFGIPIRGA